MTRELVDGVEMLEWIFENFRYSDRNGYSVYTPYPWFRNNIDAIHYEYKEEYSTKETVELYNKLNV